MLANIFLSATRQLALPGSGVLYLLALQNPVKQVLAVNHPTLPGCHLSLALFNLLLTYEKNQFAEAAHENEPRLAA